MTHGEQLVLDDANEFVRQSSEQASEEPLTSGIRPHPLVEATEQTLDTTRFGMEFSPQPEAQVEPISEGGGGPPVFGCCPAAMLVCDSVSATRSKCGFTEFGTPSDPPKYYLTKTETGTGEYHKTCSDPIQDQTQSFSGTCVTEYDPDTCEPTVTTDTFHSEHEYFGSSCSFDDTTFCGRAVDCDNIGCWFALSTWCANCAGGTGSPCDCTTDSSVSYTCFNNCDHGPPDTCSECSGTDTRNTTLSDEYTTALLISNTENALPGYSDCFACAMECSYAEGESCDCTSSRNLSDDEVTYSIQRFEYKFTFADALTDDCNICWIERTFDEDNNPLFDTQMCESVAAGSTETSVHELFEPSNNGTATVIYPIGACCTGGICSTTDETTCTDGGGEFQGSCCVDEVDGGCCSPDPCV